MMKSFICKLEQNKIIGFDLDGTLYDEFEFIAQAYLKVAGVIANYTQADTRSIYENLCMEWLKYGSSKTTLFQDVFQNYGQVHVSQRMIDACILAYRNAPFKLQLSFKTELILDYLRNNSYEIFLITDGNSELQRKKIKSLRLERWFTPSNIAISGDFGKDSQKPSTTMADKIEVLKDNSFPVLYIGDRSIDQKFAKNAGFNFLKVNNMNCMEE